METGSELSKDGRHVYRAKKILPEETGLTTFVRLPSDSTPLTVLANMVQLLQVHTRFD
jgi:hypothetical protein